MHPTADTMALIISNGAGRRVMPGVRLLVRFGPLLIEGVALAGDESALLPRRWPRRMA
jgi:hypothetical protein